MASQLVNNEGGPLVDLNAVVDLLMSRNLVQETTSLLLDVLKGNKPEEGHLQTRLLEINLDARTPQVADAIMGNAMFTYYNRQRIAHRCARRLVSTNVHWSYTEQLTSSV